MQTGLITVLSCVIYLTFGVSTEDEIKRGTYPFMAFIYYQDETILSLSGDRFLQGAVLVRSSFLISSSPESTISNDPLSKTLLARLGATIIDTKFTLNEDEYEQEQEVIQITRPSGHDSTKWWLTDICLLKTLQPIATTSAVSFTQLSTKHEPTDKVCHILVYKKKSGTDVRLLTRLFVEVLPASTDNCGVNFVEKTMTCAADQPTSDTQLSNDYCRGNNGGPLICDTDVIALQTYINGDCKPPHLYQLLSPRKRFLDCGIDEKCNNKERCPNVCTVIQKDAAAESPTLGSSELASPDPSKESTTSESPSPKPTTLAENTKAAERTESEETDTVSTPSSVANETITSTDITLSVTPTKSWPNEREGRKNNVEEADEPNRLISVEAQSRSIAEEEPTKAGLRTGTPAASIAYGHVVFQNLVYSSFLLCICLL